MSSAPKSSARWSVESKSALILAGIALSEGFFVMLWSWHNLPAFVRLLGWPSGGLMGGWLMAGLVALIYIALGWRLPSVRQTALQLSALKLLGLLVAVCAGIVEEIVFRRLLMDRVQAAGWGVLAQLIMSAVAFSAVHAVWGLMAKSPRAAAGAMITTGLLGLGLAATYLLAGRILLPCIAAHFLINAVLEPGLVLAASRGEMGSAAASRAVVGDAAA